MLILTTARFPWSALVRRGASRSLPANFSLCSTPNEISGLGAGLRCPLNARAASQYRDNAPGGGEPKATNETRLTAHQAVAKLEALSREMKDVLDGWAAAGSATRGSNRHRGSQAAPNVSGRYVFGDGPIGAAELSIDPLHRLVEPIPAREPSSLGLALHVDVDGVDPLNVVSGTVDVEGKRAHFIGRVSSDRKSYNTAEGWRRSIDVSEFVLRWPGSSVTLDKLEVEIVPTAAGPQAQATFSTSSGSTVRGPFSATRNSPFFRTVEVEMDVEKGAPALEPYDTFSHPVRPTDLERESLTLESEFAKAGIRIVRSAQTNTIDTSEAGSDRAWDEIELHDAMEEHWSRFVNKPQWRMWIFAAGLSAEGYSGLMFDGDVDVPGGTDRQGVAVFTDAEPYFKVDSDYSRANRPAPASVKREVFFTLMHEAGHAFNLFHSFHKEEETPWDRPAWAPLFNNEGALSWMNYPDIATQFGDEGFDGVNVEWFFKQFRFRFDDNENLFLRHAPAEYVQMGGSAWGHNHARARRSLLDRRLEFQLRSNKEVWEYGEPVTLELRLRNVSDEPVMVNSCLDPSSGFVDVAVTEPDGKRRVWASVMHKRRKMSSQALQPGAKIYSALNLTMGKYGFPFTKPGPHRIEASFRNHDGRMAAAVMRLYVRSPSDTETMAAVHELFNARVGRVLQVGGTRLMEDVVERLDWVSERLGERHPARLAISALRARAYGKAFKRISGDAKRLSVLDPDPEFVVRQLQPLVEDADRAADTLGHIDFFSTANLYTDCALSLKQGAKARSAQETMLAMFHKRKVIAPVVDRIAETIKTLK